jgi:hypothetical protein
MHYGNSQPITATVALVNTKIPPPKALDTQGKIAGPLLVSCVIEAELRAAKAEFDIEPQSWQLRSLHTSDTARWTWFVTPKLGGRQELELAFRPVIAVKVEQERENADPLPREEMASEHTYPIMVNVAVPRDQWMAEKFDRVTVLFKSAAGMITAFTLLVAAFIALLVKWRQGKSSPDKPTPD